MKLGICTVGKRLQLGQVLYRPTRSLRETLCSISGQRHGSAHLSHCFTHGKCRLRDGVAPQVYHLPALLCSPALITRRSSLHASTSLACLCRDVFHSPNARSKSTSTHSNGRRGNDTTRVFHTGNADISTFLDDGSPSKFIAAPSKPYLIS